MLKDIFDATNAHEHASFIKYVGIRLPVPSAHTPNTAHFLGVLKKMVPT